MSAKFQSAKTVLREQSGNHDEAEHHREEQVKQIIAGVDGGEPDPQCEEQKPGPFRREANRPPPGHAPDEVKGWGGTEVEEWVLHVACSSNWLAGRMLKNEVEQGLE